MAPSSFTENLIQSGRLPGSNMNENHHTMTGLFSNENHTSQNNQVNPTGAPSQETQRSVVGQQPYGSNDRERMQSSAIDTSKSDSYARPKQQQQPQQLDYDPDPATKSAFQNASRPIPKKNTTDSEDHLSSATNSLDSNRAIINEPLVSSQPVDPPHNETMPATYTTAQDRPPMMSDRGPLDTTGMTTAPQSTTTAPNATHQQQQQPAGDHPQGFDSSTSGRRRSSLTKRRGSTPDSECMAALPVMQSYVPYAQGVAIMRNHEARYEDDRQQAAASNRRYSLHGADEDLPSENNGTRRRSSLTETIGKMFTRRGSK
ncbi:hypothetical protein [Absidia glauca]|uniref:Uncharacterized protein n=1 Tax=Absidia glauca TaxID=4829 RepID=A0A168KQQ0_ABSGL|nr:hypothetical protein [Absidia glauca]